MNNTPHRDLIRRITLSSGESVDVYMPTLGDCEDVFTGKVTSENFTVYLMSKAIGKSIAEVRSLAITDGIIILNAINPAIEAMMLYITGDMKYVKDKLQR